MNMKVRCKFYVSSLDMRRHEHLLSEENDVPYATVHFNAVKSNQVGTENHAFWTASPNGTMKLSGKLSDLERYQPGTYWYVDFSLVDWDSAKCDHMKAKDKTKYREMVLSPNVWQLRSIATPADLSCLVVNLAMTRDWREVNGEFNMTIQNDRVWGQYTQLGDLYNVEIAEAAKD